MIDPGPVNRWWPPGATGASLAPTSAAAPMAWHKARPLNILIHARLRSMFDGVKAMLEAQRHHVVGAFSMAEGTAMMSSGIYDRIFIDIGVPHHDRLALIASAGRQGHSVIEILDADTVAREIFRQRPPLHPPGSWPARA